MYLKHARLPIPPRRHEMVFYQRKYALAKTSSFVTIATRNARSSNGRTAAFEAVNLGSNPSRASIKKTSLSGVLFYERLNEDENLSKAKSSCRMENLAES
jgi:hypothetical protein